MAKKLTDVVIRSTAKPKDKPWRLYDSEVTGLNLQISPKGLRNWTFAYRWQGKKRFKKIGGYPGIGVAAARKTARAYRAKLDTGIDPGAAAVEAKPTATLRDLLDAYLLDRERAGVRSVESMRRAFYHNIPESLLKVVAAEVTAANMTDVLREVVGRGSLTKAKHLRSYLAAAWKFGLAADLDPNIRDNPVSFGISYNVVADIPTIKGASNTRDRVLTPEELAIAWEHAHECGDPPAALALKALIASAGCRVEEITQLRWDQIDWDKKVITWETTKNKRPFIKPMGAHLEQVLRESEQLHGDRPVVFPGFLANSTPVYTGSVARTVRRLRERHEMVSWVPKDIRRTAATHLASQGIKPHVVSQLLNHAEGGITGKHYNLWAYIPEMREAVDAWDQVLTGFLKS